MPSDYKRRMQRKKAHIDAHIEQANIDKGIVVLLTGNGKGKSSSAFGLSEQSFSFNGAKWDLDHASGGYSWRDAGQGYIDINYSQLLQDGMSVSKITFSPTITSGNTTITGTSGTLYSGYSSEKTVSFSGGIYLGELELSARARQTRQEREHENIDNSASKISYLRLGAAHNFDDITLSGSHSKSRLEKTFQNHNTIFTKQKSNYANIVYYPKDNTSFGISHFRHSSGFINAISLDWQPDSNKFSVHGRVSNNDSISISLSMKLGRKDTLKANRRDRDPF